jgi:hypothetical protein
MKLESVRGLKANVFSSVVNQPQFLGASAVRSNSMGFPSHMSLGISKKGNEHVLAIRVFSRNPPWYKAVLESINKLSCGEVDVQFSSMPSAIDPPAMSFAEGDGPAWRRERTRPLKIGLSIGHENVTAGTLGAFAKVNGKICILSNNHVMANCNESKPGDKILQPGKYDKGNLEKDVVAKLLKFAPIKSKGNLVDCAVAELVSGEKYDAGTVEGVGKLSGVAKNEIEIGEVVHKFGRTTSTCHGVVTAVEIDSIGIGYGDKLGVCYFDDQIEICSKDGPFSLGGDSGSGVLNSKNQLCALLFAGANGGGKFGNGTTIVNPISHVLKALEAEILF